MPPRLLPAAVAALVLLPAALRAQLTVTADATVASGYVWRGLTFTNRPVVQQDLVLTAPAAGTTFTVGAWANGEPARYTDVSAISLDGGRGGLTATSVWADATRRVGGGRSHVDVTAGVTSYWYPPVTGLGRAYNSVEVYGRAGMGGPLAPKLGVWIDVARIRGSYVEGSVAHAFQVSPGLSVSLSGTSGVSLGQAVDPRGRDTGYFARDGVAFTDLAAGVGATFGPVLVAPSLHVVLAHDAAVRVTAPDATRGTKLWLGTTVTWAHMTGH
jgi:hypothetical protein